MPLINADGSGAAGRSWQARGIILFHRNQGGFYEEGFGFDLFKNRRRASTSLVHMLVIVRMLSKFWISHREVGW
jgi:hypothetical protein